MKGTRLTMLLAALLLSWSLDVRAFDASVIGTEIEVAYEEPRTNANGSALTDLHHTTIYYDKGGGATKAAEILATAPIGDGMIRQRITIPAFEPAEFDVRIWATASDITGNESARSNEVVTRIDRLPPAAPR